MPMSAAAMTEAGERLKVLATIRVSTFANGLTDAGLQCVGGSGVGVDWWNASDEQKLALRKLVHDGPDKAGCTNLLNDYMQAIEPDSALSQPFVASEFSRGGWFQYYYSEATMAYATLGAPAQAMLRNVTNALFLRRSQSGPPGSIAIKRAFELIDDRMLYGILFELMSIGFDRIPATLDHAIAGSTSDAAIIGRMLWAGDAAAVQGTPIKVIKVKAKWRADSRPYEDISKAQGFLTKAHSAGYAKMAGLTSAWHPLSSSDGKRYMWFRKGQRDNCLYTVVSIGKAGKDWKPYLPYPLIKLSGGNVRNVRGYKGVRKVKCVPTRAPLDPVYLDLAVTETYLYLFVLAGLAIDTGAMQGDDAYPEIGASSIPFKNVFGAVKMIRYHLGPPDTVDDECGVLCIPDAAGTVRNDENALTVRASYGEALFGKMRSRFDSAALLARPVAVRWASSGDGYEEIGLGMKSFKYGDRFFKVVLPLDVRAA